MNFIVFLQDERRRDAVGSRSAFLLPAHLKTLYLLMHRHIRRENDIERAGKPSSEIATNSSLSAAMAARAGLGVALCDPVTVLGVPIDGVSIGPFR